MTLVVLEERIGSGFVDVLLDTLTSLEYPRDRATLLVSAASRAASAGRRKSFAEEDLPSNGFLDNRTRTSEEVSLCFAPLGFRGRNLAERASRSSASAASSREANSTLLPVREASDGTSLAEPTSTFRLLFRRQSSRVVFAASV